MVRLEAGTLHLTMHLIRIAYYISFAKVDYFADSTIPLQEISSFYKTSEPKYNNEVAVLLAK